VGAYLYGGHGTNLGEPTCVALATGEICWKGRSPARGSACVLYADGHLIFRYDRGDLVLVEASPEAFRVKGRFRPLTGAGPAWAHPVIHRGKLYLRHEDLLCCYDVRAYD
jgi:outer membrane protein assembly factor BamB